MNKLLFVLLSALIVFGCCNDSDSNVIKTKIPPRAKGQTDVLQLSCEPIPVVRVAFIGLGMRGSEAVKRYTFLVIPSFSMDLT